MPKWTLEQKATFEKGQRYLEECCKENGGKIMEICKEFNQEHKESHSGLEVLLHLEEGSDKARLLCYLNCAFRKERSEFGAYLSDDELRTFGGLITQIAQNVPYLYIFREGGSFTRWGQEEEEISKIVYAIKPNWNDFTEQSIPEEPRN